MDGEGCCCKLKFLPNSVNEFLLLLIGEFPAEKWLLPALPTPPFAGDCEEEAPEAAAAAAAAAAKMPREEVW